MKQDAVIYIYTDLDVPVCVCVCDMSACSTLIVATGMWQPVQPQFEGAEYVEGYETMSTNPEDYEGQTVLILGQLSCSSLTELVIC